MNYQALTIDSLTMMYEGARVPWRPATQPFKRGMMFEINDWSERQG
jgi:hypothetical protein